MRVLDLFSGIGGFSIGLGRAGFETVAFCEIDPFCRRVLAKHWQGVPIYDDVRVLTAERLAADGVGPIDLLCGGFPCQDISTAGEGRGLSGPRSSLWWEYHRLIAEVRPAWVVIENVSRLRSKGLEQVLGGLAEIGYDAEWHCVPASAVGAPHRRDRVWVLAYPADKIRRSHTRCLVESEGSSGREAPCGPVWKGLRSAGDDGPSPRGSDGRGRDHWRVEPQMARLVDGLRPGEVSLNAALGNAVVPEIPELIGRAIIAASQTRQDIAA